MMVAPSSSSIVTNAQPADSAIAPRVESAPVSCQSYDGVHVARWEPATKLMWLEAPGDRGRELLFDQATATIVNEAKLEGLPFDGSDIYQCAFSSDGRRVYFSAKRYGTTNALMAVDVATKLIANLGGTNGFDVIYDCADRAVRGNIISNIEDYGGPFHGFHLSWFVLLDPGRFSYRIVGPIGPDEENVTRFLATRCGTGSPPPPDLVAQLNELECARGVLWDGAPIGPP
ncbi:MAG: hypothetical protein HOW73_45395 [Polyangiaceae bacterium]|nr:hypothetical protein [Polyangiaceae bacterium]